MLAQLGIEMIDEKHPHVHPGLGVADRVARSDQHNFVLIVPPTQLAHWFALIGIQQCGVHLEAAFLQEWNQAALDVIHNLVLVNPIPAFGRTVGGPRITTAMPGIQNDVELKARVVFVGGVFGVVDVGGVVVDVGGVVDGCSPSLPTPKKSFPF